MICIKFLERIYTMATFAQTQKLKAIQPVLKPKMKKKQKVQKFNFENIFNLPTEIINTIFYPTENDNYCVIYLLRLRLVCKAMLEPIEDFCIRQCKDISCQIDIYKLYYNIRIHSDVKPPSKIIYSETLTCSSCFYDSKFLTKDEKYEFYECAFKCRAYYCNNRDCNDLFGYLFQVTNFKNLTCDECNMKLARHWKGSDPDKCNRNDFDQPIHTRCVQNGRISRHCCHSCYVIENDDYWYSYSDEY